MDFTEFGKFRFILASGSPRRRELLESLGIAFKVVTPLEEEDFCDSLDPAGVVKLLAERKCRNLASGGHEGEVIISADTIVVCDSRILNKPATREEAIEYLQFLSGRTHSVITGVAILYRDKVTLFSTETEVDFGELVLSDTEYYIDKFKPYDKAGAYGIQEWIGMIGIKEIRGCYYNVMGLPLYDLYSNLKMILNSKNEKNESEI